VDWSVIFCSQRFKTKALWMQCGLLTRRVPQEMTVCWIYKAFVFEGFMPAMEMTVR